MEKDWTGNKKTTFVQLGASNHSDKERETNDYYATDPHALELLLESLKNDNIKLHNNIWECACGQGHLSQVLENEGYEVISTDLVNRGFGLGGVDFLKADKSIVTNEKFDILTNPPYKYAEKFVYKTMDLLNDDCYGIFFLKIQFLEGKSRYNLYQKYPPKYVYVNSSRQCCAMNGDFEKYRSNCNLLLLVYLAERISR